MKTKQERPTHIEVTNKCLTFKGHPLDAIAISDDIREAHTEAGTQPDKVISDWLFAIECELQHAGYMDEDFMTIH